MPSGGKRPGSGRRKGTPNKATKEVRDNIAELAREYAPSAMQTLNEICVTGQTESARVSAATAILDRAYGKPVQALHHGGADGGAIVYAREMTDAELLSVAAGGGAGVVAETEGSGEPD